MDKYVGVGSSNNSNGNNTTTRHVDSYDRQRQLMERDNYDVLWVEAAADFKQPILNSIIMLFILLFTISSCTYISLTRSRIISDSKSVRQDIYDYSKCDHTQSNVSNSVVLLDRRGTTANYLCKQDSESSHETLYAQRVLTSRLKYLLKDLGK